MYDDDTKRRIEGNAPALQAAMREHMAANSPGDAAAVSEHEGEWDALDSHLREMASRPHVGGQSGAAEEAWQSKCERFREWADMVKRERAALRDMESQRDGYFEALCAVNGRPDPKVVGFTAPVRLRVHKDGALDIELSLPNPNLVEGIMAAIECGGTATGCRTTREYQGSMQGDMTVTKHGSRCPRAAR